MSKEQLKHIFEQSACLTPRQVKNYVSGKMVHEEAHVVEAHLLGCPLCSDAVEGIIENKTQGALAAMEKPDMSFLSKHLGLPLQEIKTTTTTAPVIKARPYATQPEKTEKKGSTIPWKTFAAAAGLITIAYLAWFMRDSIFPHTEEQQLAQTSVAEPEPVQEMSYNATTDTIPAMEEDTSGIVTMTEQTLQTPVTTTTPPAKTTQEVALLAKKEAEKKVPLKKVTEKADAARAITAASQGNNSITENKPPAAAPATATPQARMGNSFTGPEAPTFDAAADVAETRTETVAKRKVNIAKRASNGMDKADEFYNSGKYKKALKIYQDEMYDSKSNKKDAATLMAAQCHIGLGQEEQAKTLLNTLVNKNSVKKQQAQQLLTQMGE